MSREDTVQVNVRVPDGKPADLMKRAGARLRTDDGFARRLEKLLASLADPITTQELDERLSALEARVEDLAQR